MFAPMVVAPLALAALAAAPAWQVTYAESGGLAGPLSDATVTVTSAGEVTLARLAGTCAGLKADPARLAALARAVRRARPGRWAPRYVQPGNPRGCCDLVSTRLALAREGSVARETGWFDDARGLAPADARAVADAARALLRAHRRCAATPPPRGPPPTSSAPPSPPSRTSP
ncbi:hypothetical protein [Anaeromyxobacter paludicola]|uniref:Uncharacterized protein n=1 Tax=Anaeromyxobacter paludicola TaxID=2918171 RepID=A0ABM7XEY3_9BACT|nr:hypothetical protein [Anaeromyxobacter paludicola]BDG10415.1 hypothetical protein AMPC_35280 [Anaeromyxobacter paludicola]